MFINKPIILELEAGLLQAHALQAHMSISSGLTELAESLPLPSPQPGKYNPQHLLWLTGLKLSSNAATTTTCTTLKVWQR
jgi:hypothetical protein